MGTRGLLIILFRGRYFVYCNHWDSYPGGLGEQLVQGIPVDPEDYTAWLEHQCAFNAKLTAKLETKVLLVTTERMRQVLASEEAQGNEKEDRRVEPIWREVDSELQELPSPLCTRANDFRVEWIYLMDLDSELFSINNHITFDLWNIPHDRWTEAFNCDEESGFEVCPEASWAIEPPDYFADPGDHLGKYHATYRQFSISMVVPIDIDYSSHASLQQIVGLALFDKLADPFAHRFWGYVPGLGHDGFAFRELAFAILSFATGNIYFDRPDRFHGRYSQEESEGYLVHRDDGGEPRLMPLFGSSVTPKINNPDPPRTIAYTGMKMFW